MADQPNPNPKDAQDALEVHDLVADINVLQRDALTETTIPKDL